VDDAVRVDEGERAEDLRGDLLDARDGKLGVLPPIGEGLLESLQIVLQELRDDEEVLLLVKLALERKDGHLVLGRGALLLLVRRGGGARTDARRARGAARRALARRVRLDVRVELAEELDLVERLVEELLVVFDDLIVRGRVGGRRREKVRMSESREIVQQQRTRK
jgi:hypothetical protein